MRKLNSVFLENCSSTPAYTPNYAPHNERGNALIYILIALALIGALTVLVTSQTEYSDSEDISRDQAQLYALELLDYAVAAQAVIDQMEMTGTSVSEFDFINPTSSGFNTAPNIHKIFHPQGGGLNYKETNDFAEDIFLSTSGWQFTSANNVEWTPSSASDIVLSALDISETVCSLLNEKVNGPSTIPVATDTLTNLLSDSASADLTATNCANCEGYPSLCLEDSGGDYGFYNILLGR